MQTIIFDNNGVVPIGTVVPYAGPINMTTGLAISAVPGHLRDFSKTPRNNTGWIICDGADTPISLFPELFGCLGYYYGTGHGDGLFNVPDYRGYFLRGLDTLDHHLDPGLENHPDDEDQRTPARNGSKNGVGSIQQQMVQMHEHHYKNHISTASVFGEPAGPAAEITRETLTTTQLVVNDVSVKGTETRPVNIYVIYLIFAGRIFME